QKQLSKEFVRQWLIANGFQGKEGQQIPVMQEEFIEEISARYIELYEHVTGKQFVPQVYDETEVRVFANVQRFLAQLA
ncbi:MAG TPA: phosphoribosylaminoimidazolesuccinocarboxamide synthase, partial [Flavobacteriales bacterium]|nr:phosphoribosylaminoimidazolesuccinocarboxamide synthase [Flavobacteriales bacterium]